MEPGYLRRLIEMNFVSLILPALGIVCTLSFSHDCFAQQIFSDAQRPHEKIPIDFPVDTDLLASRRVRHVDALDGSIEKATAAIMAHQKEDGHWIYEFESDATFSSQYILLVHYLGEPPNATLEQKLARYLRRNQLPSGGWALFAEGPMNINPSVQAYFALKMAGDSPDAEHMTRARHAIRAAGGAETVNVFTRILLALFGVLPWDAVPMMPVETMLLPDWFPFHLSKISYWARAVIVPLLVVANARPIARNPRRVHIDELFISPPDTVGLAPRAPHQSETWSTIFRSVDAVLRFTDPFSPADLRQRAIDAAVAWVDERNFEDGLGAIFPAIFNSVIMYDLLGNRTARDIAHRRLGKLLIVRDDEAYCQAVRSPVWDTALVAQALLETRDPRAAAAAKRALEWLVPRQILDLRGDWSLRRPNLRPGGWTFYYDCPHYPDVDDTAVIVMAMQRSDPEAFARPIGRAREWVVGIQSSNGGWGAYEAENTHEYLNNMPFSDHGAMLDPPTADVTGRCLSMLAQLGEVPAGSETARRALEFLMEEQEEDGSWFGRWGVNYIYGTWTVLSALNAAGLAHDDERVRRAVGWLVSIQNADGGWGEDCASYKLNYTGYETAPSIPSQTAWAVLGLMAAGEVRNPAVARGVAWLRETQQEHGLWAQTRYSGTGFPRVLFLHYHGYFKYFPLWALARYRNLKNDNLTRVPFGM